MCTASDQCHVAGTCDSATGICSNPNKADGSGCTDSDACTQTDSCQSGTCTGANPVTCAALDQCHAVGTCDPQSGTCSHPVVADGTGCNDGNACTQSDTCQSGTCTGANPVTCTASDPCHVIGTCNPANGACSSPVAPNGTGCNDGNPCTQTDTCQTGACIGANQVFCVPLDQCHNAGVCQPASGLCSNPAKAAGTACDDGNDCTTSDVCSEGSCSGTAGTVPGNVASVLATKSGTTAVFNWSATAEASSYDMLRGRVSSWPVGSSPATETCFGGVLVNTASDGTVPGSGVGYWYLVRAQNACGSGGYGSQASNGIPTVPRLSGTCP